MSGDKPAFGVNQMGLESSDQIDNPNAQCVGQGLERLERDIALPALDFSDMRPVQAGLVGEQILRPAVFLAQRTDLRPDLFLDGLHQKQCGASLVLSILVITSETEHHTTAVPGAKNNDHATRSSRAHPSDLCDL